MRFLAFFRLFIGVCELKCENGVESEMNIIPFPSVRFAV